jgi:predicted ArsR family transcriptional regulator
VAKTPNGNRSPGEVVANPVRLAIVRALRDRGELTLDELADAAQVHRNTIRSHCGALEAAGTIDRAAPVPGTRPGRPMVRYRLAAIDEPDALSRFIGTALGDSGISATQARRLGLMRGAALADLLPKRRRLAALRGQLAELGFRADVRDDRIELTGCPCPVVAPGNPAVVCALVAGAVDGVLEASDVPERVAGGEHDPAARRCTLRLSAT